MQNESAARKARPTISVVIPVFNEEDNIGLVYDALAEVSSKTPDFDMEFLFVEDGSSDATFTTLQARHRADSRVKVIQLSRNYGSHVGAAAGLNYATGDAVVVMPADLQDHPREIPRLVERWREGIDVVWAVRSSRADSPTDRFFSALFARVIRFVALPNYPLTGTGSFCLLDRIVVDALNQFPEHNRVTFGLILYSGFPQAEILYDRGARTFGRSKWSFRRKVRLFIDTVVSFSTTPIKVASVSGIVFALVGMLYALYVVAFYLFFGTAATPGWSSLFVLIMMMGGFQLIVLGMLGEYIARSVDDVRRRPLYLVRRTLGTFERAGGAEKAIAPVP